jgi:hypothetical protein
VHTTTCMPSADFRWGRPTAPPVRHGYSPRACCAWPVSARSRLIALSVSPTLPTALIRQVFFGTASYVLSCLDLFWCFAIYLERSHFLICQHTTSSLPFSSTMSFTQSSNSDRQRAATAYDWRQYPFADSSHDPSPQTVEVSNDRRHLSYMWSGAGGLSNSLHTTSQSLDWLSDTRWSASDLEQTPTQAMFDPGPHSWHEQAESIFPATSMPEYTRSVANLHQHYSSADMMSSMTAWDFSANHHTAFVPGCDRSSSRSSQASTTASSPYAHSDGYFQASSPPMIKLESPEYGRSNVYSTPTASLTETQLLHIDPGALLTSASSSTLHRSNYCPFPSQVKVEQQEHASSLDHERQQRASDSRIQSAVSPDCTSSETRTKRGFTTPTTSTCHCESCGRLFQRTYNLRAHMETHDPQREQPFACEYDGCTRRFVRRTDLVRHEQSVSVYHHPVSFPC